MFLSLKSILNEGKAYETHKVDVFTLKTIIELENRSRLSIFFDNSASSLGSIFLNLR
jgi:hypothetical protein